MKEITIKKIFLMKNDSEGGVIDSEAKEGGNEGVGLPPGAQRVRLPATVLFSGSKT